mmetsp:Transcript_11413/g.14120  ORF Transcript_11413/g.14120 Transcript_11413/m.14120 type:complete len:92 (-) Transcript_11413:57-332(-)
MYMNFDLACHYLTSILKLGEWLQHRNRTLNKKGQEKIRALPKFPNVPWACSRSFFCQYTCTLLRIYVMTVSTTTTARGSVENDFMAAKNRF